MGDSYRSYWVLFVFVVGRKAAWFFLKINFLEGVFFKTSFGNCLKKMRNTGICLTVSKEQSFAYRIERFYLPHLQATTAVQNLCSDFTQWALRWRKKKKYWPWVSFRYNLNYLLRFSFNSTSLPKAFLSHGLMRFLIRSDEKL